MFFGLRNSTIFHMHETYKNNYKIIRDSRCFEIWFLARKVYYQTSLCNHDLSVVHSYHVHNPPNHRTEHGNFIFGMNMHICPQYMQIKSFLSIQCGISGTGHYSPVGGYHPGRDLVLVLDTARFKYPPYWVSLSDLYKSMQDSDPETG